MDDPRQGAALIIVVGALMFAFIGTLWQKTVDIRGIGRVLAMIRLAPVVLWRALLFLRPSTPVTVGLIVYALIVTLGVLITFSIMQNIPLQVPNPNEAYEGIGDGMLLLAVFLQGLMLSNLVGVIIGYLVCIHVASQIKRRSTAKTLNFSQNLDEPPTH